MRISQAFKRNMWNNKITKKVPFGTFFTLKYYFFENKVELRKIFSYNLSN